MEDIHIRKALRTDAEQIHALIRELGIYEKAEHEIQTTPEQFAQDGFGERPLYESFVAINEEKRVIGTALFYFAYSTWKGKMLYLDDLIVTESYRRKGIGMRLLDTLMNYAKETNTKMVKWQVLNWNEPAIQFYEKIGAALDDEWINCSLNSDKIQRYIPGGTYIEVI